MNMDFSWGSAGDLAREADSATQDALWI